jgi:hypothetical protein
MKWLFALLCGFLFLSCNNGFTGPLSPGRVERVDRSKRTVIDASEYIDFTVAKYNAAMYKKEDILLNANGSFRLENGNSFIKIDRAKGRITLSSDHAANKIGQQFYAEYAFDVAAANKDCLYIRIADKSHATMIFESNSYKNEQVPDLMACIPLYGFGRNRLEVSSVMNGFIGMPSGTYWRENK